ncbi:hypothetical protein SIO70_24455 [Chitinophaga sancti]|uniref:hypothetical protein n=1 Tax=Chitinophaga sancti TaxID=1004 RepID=UPI002A766105|nr:hypothetical protein [Chitinophaga sancti]WPQ61515.1 hypothetical protein SIO70_24455 [Chitinophaga sancti]
MKKIIIALTMTVMATGAFAMGPGHGGGGFHGGGRTTVIVSGGFGYYSPFYSPFGWGFGYGYPYYAAPYRPTKLDMQVMDIKNDYADRIASVKMDRDLSGRERRQEVRQLKRERDNAVYDAKRNYYKQQMERRQQSQPQQQPQEQTQPQTQQQ